jgi:hypothetical protein
MRCLKTTNHSISRLFREDFERKTVPTVNHNTKLVRKDEKIMQNLKMEANEQQQQTGIQVMPTVLGNGQQIILQSLQQQLNAANGQQQMQLVPIIQGSQGTSYIVQPQASQPQIVQLPDGQTFIYHQPMAMPEAQQSQPQIVNINGNFFQIPAQQTVQQAAIQTQSTPTSPQQTQQVVMIPQQQAPTEPQIQQTATTVSNFNANSAPSPPPQPSTSNTPTPTPVESEEEPLYVNASKLRLFFTSQHQIIVFLLLHYRTIQKNSNPPHRPSETRSARKNSKATTEISVRESSSARYESDSRRRRTVW